MKKIFAFLALSTMTCYADFTETVARHMNDKDLGEEMMSVHSGGVILYIMNCEESEMLSIAYFSEDFPVPTATVSIEFLGGDRSINGSPEDVIAAEPAEEMLNRFLGMSAFKFSKQRISDARAIRFKVLGQNKESLLFLEMNLKGIANEK